MKFQHQQTSGISSANLLKTIKTCLPYRDRLAKIVSAKNWQEPEASLLLPFDASILSKAKKMAARYASKSLKNIVVIGIGGSNLGTQAVYDALCPQQKNIDSMPEMLFLDTVSSTHMAQVIHSLSTCRKKEEFVLVAISKSGSTTETMVNLEILIDQLKKKFGDVKNRLVVISDDGSKFWNMAIAKKIDVLAIPKTVGGRYSVFSAVGLFPLLLAGFTVSAFVQGAKKAIESELGKNPSEQPALISACLTHLQNKNHRSIHNCFFFAPELESLGKWERQLMGESIGKEKNLVGKKVNIGITPIVSIGSTDLHSLAQLYFGGPDDKFTHLVSVKSMPDVSMPKSLVFPGLVDHIETKKMSTVMSAILGGISSTYLKLKRPFVSTEFDRIDEKELGTYMQTRMLEMMYLAHLLQVNAFDQPSVEGYKLETKRLMK